MNKSAISRDIALRIALAARLIPETQPARIIKVLHDVMGLNLDVKKLSTLNIDSLKNAANGELSDIDKDVLIQVLAFLRGEKDIDENEYFFQLDSYEEGDMASSIRVAFASNTAEDLDGHFGSCARFLIYQVNAIEKRLIDVRSTNGPEAWDDKNTYRANLVNDCQILFVASIGGPAAAKVVRAGVHPVKYPDACSVKERLQALQNIITDLPPPWLAKAMGHGEQSRVRFEQSSVDV